jgi:hypothetical protein
MPNKRINPLEEAEKRLRKNPIQEKLKARNPKAIGTIKQGGKKSRIQGEMKKAKQAKSFMDLMEFVRKLKK